MFKEEIFKKELYSILKNKKYRNLSKAKIIRAVNEVVRAIEEDKLIELKDENNV